MLHELRNTGLIRGRLAALLTCLAWGCCMAAPARADEAAYRNFMAAAADATQRGEHAGSVTLLEGAIRNAEPFGAHDLRLAAALSAMGRAKRSLHDYVPAEAHYQRALAIYEGAGAGAREPLAAVYHGLGELRQLQDRLGDAEQFYLRELALLEQVKGPEHPDVARALANNLASVYRAQSRNDDVERAYTRALAIWERNVPPNDTRLGLALVDLGEWYKRVSRYAEADGYFRRGIPIVASMFPPAHTRMFYLLQDWGQVNQLQGRYAEAERIYKQLLTVVETTFGMRHPSVGAALNNLVGIYQMQGRQNDATVARSRMLDLGMGQFRGQPHSPYVVGSGRR